MNLYTLTSDLHGEMSLNAREERFIQDIEKALDSGFCHKGQHYGDYGQGDDVIYVRTGGTEGSFKAVFAEDGSPIIPGGKTVRLLTSGQSNSLAASMEILSYLRQHDIPGQIVHGSADEIARTLKGSAVTTSGSMRRKLMKNRILEGRKMGVIGKPSDWLISSDVDPAKAREMLGVELIEIEMSELLREIETVSCGEIRTAIEKAGLKDLNTAKYGKPISPESFSRSIAVYCALRKIVDRYGLSGLTIRCFDLLGTIGNTGCMALAILNSEGITGTCEGDVPAMLTMAVAKEVTSKSSFQVNLSKAQDDSLLFAHCTVPLDIIENYCYDTHFESGTGVAVHGEFAPGAATVIKIGADLNECVIEDVEIERNQYENNLCRTQIIVKAKGLRDYMLTEPLGNHHVIIPGHHTESLVDAITL